MSVGERDNKHLPNILLVTKDAALAEILEPDFLSWGYQVFSCGPDYSLLQRSIKVKIPLAIVVDLDFIAMNEMKRLSELIKGVDTIHTIWITSEVSRNLILRAREAMPQAILTKPVKAPDLLSHFELSLSEGNLNEESNRSSSLNRTKPFTKLSEAVFVRQGQYIKKILIEDILFLRSDNQYMYIHTAHGSFAVRTSLGGFQEFLDDPKFCRVHRAYVVNLQKLDSITSEHLVIKNHQIPIGNSYRGEFFKSIRVF